MTVKSSTGNQRELTLKDRLSHLTYRQACRLLGGSAAQLIRLGGKHEIDIDEDVYLRGDLFRLSLHGPVVTITQMAEAGQHLSWNGTQCHGACEHVGAALSLILEEKMALGLAAPPPERVPVESLGEAALVERAIAERKARARKQRMTVRSSNPKKLWTDYLVTNAESGKTYRAALRGWEPGESYCSCPDCGDSQLPDHRGGARNERTRATAREGPEVSKRAENVAPENGRAPHCGPSLCVAAAPKRVFQSRGLDSAIRSAGRGTPVAVGAYNRSVRARSPA